MLRCPNCGNILESQEKGGLCRRCEKLFSERCPACHGEKRSMADGARKCPICQGAGRRK